MKPSVAVSKLVQETKGYSSYLVNHVFQPGSAFKWQGSYGVIAVPYEAVPQVAAYIRNQAAHHADGSLIADLERTMVERPTRG